VTRAFSRLLRNWVIDGRRGQPSQPMTGFTVLSHHWIAVRIDIVEWIKLLQVLMNCETCIIPLFAAKP
jgi:hypothetical protein